MSWKAWAMLLIGAPFMGAVGYSLYLVQSYLVYVGFTWLVVLELTPAIGLVIAITFMLRYFFGGQFIGVDQFGGYFRRFGKMTPLPPLTAITPATKVGTTVTELAPNVPRLAQLIEENALTREEEGKALMFQGYRVDESRRYGDWPGVIAVTGMQNVGKSITMMMLIIIALLSGAHVVVCDTHHTKPRSLYKKVMCLGGLVTFALTEEAVLAETQKFKQELFDRKQGKPLFPYVIFYDEFCSLIRARNDELREVLPETMEEASQEGLGYQLHLVCAIHDMSNSGIGDARLRSFFNFVYCHKMEAGQSKFIDAFKGKYGKLKAQTVIAGLPQGHVMTRDEVNEIEYLIIPNGSSKDALLVRDKMQQLGGPPNRPEIPEISSFKNRNENFSQGEISISEPDFTLKSENPETEISDFKPEEFDLTTYEGRKSEVKKLWSMGFSKQSEVIELVWGKDIRPGENKAYQDARAEYKRILIELSKKEGANV